MRIIIARTLGSLLVWGGLSVVLLAAPIESANFRITAPNEQVARQVAELAEKYRKQKALEWLGREMPNWGQKCPLTVKLTPGGRGTSGGGATTFAFDRGSILEQHMQVEGDLEQVLYSVLPHEITHTVFAFHFRDKVPRWADEGGSVLSENDFERGRHDDLVRRSLATGKAFRLRYLFDLENYPRDGQDVMTLYAQGYAVVRHLVERSSKPAFLNFLRDAKVHGWDQALRTHYNVESVEVLEQQWIDWMKRGMRTPNLVAANARLPEGGPPAQAESSPAPVRQSGVAQPTGKSVELGVPRVEKQSATPRPPVTRPRGPMGGSGQQGWSPLGTPEQASSSPAKLQPPKVTDLPP